MPFRKYYVSTWIKSSKTKLYDKYKTAQSHPIGSNAEVKPIYLAYTKLTCGLLKCGDFGLNGAIAWLTPSANTNFSLQSGETFLFAASSINVHQNY